MPIVAAKLIRAESKLTDGRLTISQLAPTEVAYPFLTKDARSQVAGLASRPRN
jgi:hypothetical protein